MGEINALRPEDIDFDIGVIHVKLFFQMKMLPVEYVKDVEAQLFKKKKVNGC